MTRTVLLGAMIGLLLATPPARAADIPVSYNVEQVALKAAVSGTQLTFSLYTDGACSLAHASQMVAVDDVVPLEKIRSVKPKGGATPPKVARLNFVLSGIASAPELYLVVTGTGISPVGGACQ